MNMTMRKKLYTFLASAVIIHFLFIYAKSSPFNSIEPALAPSITTDNSLNSDKPANNKLALYDSLNLEQLGLSRQAYDYAVKGFNYLLASGKLNNDHVLSIVDFSKASAKKRLFVIDLNEGKVLFNTYVSHGRNSGREMAKEFSNEPESFKSSLGFYVTGATYNGKHGFSMRLLGEEKGINDNANSRAIVMHSAAYVSESAIRAQGFIGRSLGCPALPVEIYKPVIEKIKNGSCLFIYSPDTRYAANSSLLKKIA
jgi:hypothetical protein